MARIELKNGYYIEVDSLNYTLRQKYIRNAKDGSKKRGHTAHADTFLISEEPLENI